MKAVLVLERVGMPRGHIAGRDITRFLQRYRRNYRHAQIHNPTMTMFNMYTRSFVMVHLRNSIIVEYLMPYPGRWWPLFHLIEHSGTATWRISGIMSIKSRTTLVQIELVNYKAFLSPNRGSLPGACSLPLWQHFERTDPSWQPEYAELLSRLWWTLSCESQDSCCLPDEGPRRWILTRWRRRTSDDTTGSKTHRSNNLYTPTRCSSGRTRWSRKAASCSIWASAESPATLNTSPSRKMQLPRRLWPSIFSSCSGWRWSTCACRKRFRTHMNLQQNIQIM